MILENSIFRPHLRGLKMKLPIGYGPIILHSKSINESQSGIGIIFLKLIITAKIKFQGSI